MTHYSAVNVFNFRIIPFYNAIKFWPFKHLKNLKNIVIEFNFEGNNISCFKILSMYEIPAGHSCTPDEHEQSCTFNFSSWLTKFVTFRLVLHGNLQ
jgi:hypothetical protein